MKKVWIEVDTWDKGLITDALENGADAFFVTDPSFHNKIEELARADVYDASDPPEWVRFISVDSKEAEEEAARISDSVSLIIETGNWRVIPFENLIAQRGNLFARVSTVEEAREALEILETGVDGVYVSGCSSDEKLNVLKLAKGTRGSIDVTEGTIESVEKLGSGDRICIDTITNMENGEGMLVGDYSKGMVLVNSESLENPYVASRPFRVNAGAVHSYVMTEGGRTKYLADLRSGDAALTVNYKGETVPTTVGRIKQERRPMLRITISGNLDTFSTVLQNAETIRVVTPDGGSKSVVKLQPGDKVVIHEESGGRHFGHKIKESIDEK